MHLSRGNGHMPNARPVLTHEFAANIAIRGVYRLPFLGRGGELLLVAVDSDGRRVAEASVYVGQSPYPIEAALRDLLDQISPPPSPLHLVA